MWPSYDHVAVGDPFDATDAAPLELEQHRLSEDGLVAFFHHVSRIVDRDDDGLVVRSWISKAHHETAIGGGGQAFDIEPVVRLLLRSVLLLVGCIGIDE